MKHGIDLYAKPITIGYANREYVYGYEWRKITLVMNIVCGALMVLTVTLGLIAIDVEGSDGIPHIFWMVLLPLALALYGGHWLMSWTYDAKDLRPGQIKALNVFNSLPDEVKAEVGGRDNILSAIRGMTNTQELVDKMIRAKKAHQEYLYEQAALSSSKGEVMRALDAYVNEKKDYIQTLKELR